jgi:AraC family transcriptional regulator, regulatory protein of adaptative response / DNA-3-methyladenine glycosylase II
MTLDSDRCRHAVASGDPRFDGWFVCAVTSTGIYCRPSCPARTPKRENVRFFPTTAAAQAAGFRACRRCRPDAAPGSPEWDRGADLPSRAMRLIADGLVDREGVEGLARRLACTEAELHRSLAAATGATPAALARARRAQAAMLLLENTDLQVADVAAAAGFAGTGRLRAAVRAVFARTPTELRRRRAARQGPGELVLRLPYRAPIDAEGLIAFLAARAVPAVEEVAGGMYRRSLRLPHAGGAVELRALDGHMQARLRLDDLRDLGPAVQRCRALLDLDADPVAVRAALGADAVLAPAVRAAPGRRVAGHVDGTELAVRAVLGQQVSLAGAATLAGRLVAARGEPLTRPLGSVTHLFPSADALASADPDSLAMPASRRRALLGLAAALARKELTLDAGADRAEAERRLLALPGIGPWTAAYVSMRALRDPDAFLAGDLGVRHALQRLGQDPHPAAAERLAEGWRPYRAYAMQHLWAGVAA